MTADALTFDLTARACINIAPGRVTYLHENDVVEITHTNLGRFLLAYQGWDARKRVTKPTALAVQ
jgi:hypothetical protein